MSPHELYFGKKLNFAHLRVFSSIVYVHVPKEKRKKLDAKAEKCTLVGYSDEQKDYKCYNPRTKQACVSRDVVFDESVWWWLSSPQTPEETIPTFEEEVNEAEMPRDEGDIGALEESPISFRLSGLNERLSRGDQSDKEATSTVESVMQSPRRKPRRRLTHKEKGKKKMLE